MNIQTWLLNEGVTNTIKQNKQIIDIYKDTKTVVISMSTVYFKMDFYDLVKKIFLFIETIKK